MFLQVINFSSTTIAVFIGVVGILSILAQVTTQKHPPISCETRMAELSLAVSLNILQHMFMIVHTSFIRSTTKINSSFPPSLYRPSSSRC